MPAYGQVFGDGGVDAAAVEAIIADYLATHPAGLTGEQVQAAIEAYAAANPDQIGLSEAQVQSAIAAYAAAHPDQVGTSPQQVQDAIADYAAAHPGVSNYSPAGSVPGVEPMCAVGEYYSIAPQTGGTGTSTAQHLYLTPIVITERSSWDRISVRLLYGGSGAVPFYVGLYASNANGKPSTAIALPAQMTASATGFYAATINVTLAPGLYWIAYHGASGLTAYVSSSSFHTSRYVSSATTGVLGFSYYVLNHSATSSAVVALPTDMSTKTVVPYGSILCNHELRRSA